MNGRFSLVIILLFSFALAHAKTDDLATAAEVPQDPVIAPQDSVDVKTDPVEVKTDAVEDTELDKLIQLVNNNDVHGAYLLGLDMQQEWEGDEEFDFNFGFAAAQTGHYNQAIFSFERLLQSHPKNLRFRLELARCHYFLKNYNAAEHEFNQVKKSKPPENVEQQIDKFLVKIAEQKQQVSRSWQLGGGLAGGYDSNINAAADLLKASKRPVIIAGGGALEAADSILAIAEKLISGNSYPKGSAPPSSCPCFTIPNALSFKTIITTGKLCCFATVIS